MYTAKKTGIAFLAAFLLFALAGCQGAGGGGSNDGPAPGPNSDRSTWGYYQGQNEWTWYISGSEVQSIAAQVRCVYTIDSADATGIRAHYIGKIPADANRLDPQNTDLVLTRTGPESFRSSAVMKGDGQWWSFPFTIMKAVGKEISFTGVARTDDGSAGILSGAAARAIKPLGGIKLIIKNIENDDDIQQVLTDADGGFEATDAIPTDTYTVSVGTDGGFDVQVTPPCDDSDVGPVVVAAPAAYSITTSFVSTYGGIIQNHPGSLYFQYHIPEIPATYDRGIFTVGLYYGDTRIGSNNYSPWSNDNFSYTLSSTQFNSLSIPADPGYTDILLTVKVSYYDSEGVYAAGDCSCTIPLRVYAKALYVKTKTDVYNNTGFATIVNPDRSYTELDMQSLTMLPLLKGDYYICIAPRYKHTDVPYLIGFAEYPVEPDLTGDPTVYEETGTKTDAGSSRATADVISLGDLYSGAVSGENDIDCIKLSVQ